MPPSLSLIIPTHRRVPILKQCLEHLQKQTIADQLEVIVVSDGPGGDTRHMLEEVPEEKFPIIYFEIPKSHQGVARNRGVEKATAPLALFIGDDIFLAPDACEKHLQAHKQLAVPAAVLGFTTWDPAFTITPTMKWLEKTGWQFGYPLLIPYPHAFVPADIQHRFTYTSHISLPADVAKAHPFKENITLYGWEDMVWGQELRDSGIRLFYEPDAKALHHHPITLEDSLRRMEVLGESLKYLKTVAPALDRRPRGLKLLAYKLIALTQTMRGKHYRAFLRGLREGH